MSWVLALIALGIFVDVAFAISTWRRAEHARLQSHETHALVNSRLDEFKAALTTAALVSVEEFRKEITRSVQGVLRGPPGAKGDKGDRGESGRGPST